jgi:hypothetical protein
MSARRWLALVTLLSLSGCGPMWDYMTLTTEDYKHMVYGLPAKIFYNRFLFEEHPGNYSYLSSTNEIELESTPYVRRSLEADLLLDWWKFATFIYREIEYRDGSRRVVRTYTEDSTWWVEDHLMIIPRVGRVHGTPEGVGITEGTWHGTMFMEMKQSQTDPRLR